MKKRSLVLSAFAIFATIASASASCKSAALWAAESEYGNDPVRTYTKTIKDGEEYQITVGIGNAEDGAHTYRVSFKNGVCSPKTADVVEIGNG
jgi:hypothetical protein